MKDKIKVALVILLIMLVARTILNTYEIMELQKQITILTKNESKVVDILKIHADNIASLCDNEKQFVKVLKELIK